MDPLQCMMHFAEAAMPGAHLESQRDHAVVVQNHRGHKRSATRGKAKGELKVPGGVCTVGEIPREMETSRLFCPLGICSLAESRMGYAGLLLQAVSLPIVQLVDANRLWCGGKGMFSPMTRGAHGVAGTSRAGTCHPFPWMLSWALSPPGSRETQLAEDLMVLGFSQLSATFGSARTPGDRGRNLLQLQFLGRSLF